MVWTDGGTVPAAPGTGGCSLPAVSGGGAGGRAPGGTGRPGITGLACAAAGCGEAVGACTPGEADAAGNVTGPGRPCGGLAGCGAAGGSVTACAISTAEAFEALEGKITMEEPAFDADGSRAGSAFAAAGAVTAGRSPRDTSPAGAAASMRGWRQASSRNSAVKARERIGALSRSDCPCPVCAIIRPPFLRSEPS